MALAIYTVAIFLSAALLFSVQPMFARLVLPSLGGAPAVWNSCLFFFQGVLLAGYLYVHVSSQFLSPRRQLILHSVVILLPLMCLPIILRQPRVSEDSVTATDPISARALWQNRRSISQTRGGR